MKQFLVILLLLAATASSYGQPASGQPSSNSLTIEQVVIRGNRRIPAPTIKAWITTHKGGVYKPKQLDRDIHALFETGHFEDAKVYVEDGERGGKIITFEVRERPLILAITYEGLDARRQEEVAAKWRKQKIDLSSGSEYNAVMVRRAAQIIRNLLASEGENNPMVNPMVTEESKTEVSVLFKVE